MCVCVCVCVCKPLYVCVCVCGGWGGFPGGASGKEPSCQCKRPKRCGFNPWVGKIPWRRERQPTPILAWRIPWTEESGRLQFIGPQSWTRLKWFSMNTHIWCNLWCPSRCSRGITISSQSRSGAFNTTPLKICSCFFLTVQKNSQMSRLHWRDPRGRPLMILFTGFLQPKRVT